MRPEAILLSMAVKQRQPAWLPHLVALLRFVELHAGERAAGLRPYCSAWLWSSNKQRRCRTL